MHWSNELFEWRPSRIIPRCARWWRGQRKIDADGKSRQKTNETSQKKNNFDGIRSPFEPGRRVYENNDESDTRADNNDRRTEQSLYKIEKSHADDCKKSNKMKRSLQLWNELQQAVNNRGDFIP